MKKFTVAIVGLGARGYHTYAQYQKTHPDRMQIVAIADTDKTKLELVKNEFNVKEEMCFSSANELLEKDRLADVIFITTQDNDHYEQTLKAISKGYDILLEKPISNDPLNCIEIRNEAIKNNTNITVCHVLRYTKFFNVIKEAIKNGKIGDVVSIQAIENVCYWHMAHSFVRGNWRNSDLSSPMILQKCCHDLDIFNWLLEKKCISLSSYGSLKYFKEENAPEDTSDYCYNCRLKDECPYSAYQIYIENENGIKNGNVDWPVNIIMENPTIEEVKEKLKTSQYGRCVYRCDNNVVDHQVINLAYEDEITVSFTMCGFTDKMTRYIKIMGTKGEIIADQTPNTVIIKQFGNTKEEVIDINKVAEDLSGHGGGDNNMLTDMFNALENGDKTDSTVATSIASHVAAFAAEYSRKHDGESIKLEEYERICKREKNE